MRILDLTKCCRFGEVPQTPGKLKLFCASKRVVHGKPLGEQEKVRVALNVEEDLDVLQTQGPKAPGKIYRDSARQHDVHKMVIHGVGLVTKIRGATIISSIRRLMHFDCPM